MKTLSLALLLVASMAFVLLGCSDNSTPIASPSDQAVSPTTSLGSLAKMGADLHSVTGSAHWRMIGTQTRVRFSFSAVQHADGSITGEVLDLDEGPYINLHGKVYDLAVEGNRARISFNIIRGMLAGTVPLDGMVASFVVIDNGEGKSASGPDKVSLITGDPPGTYESPIWMTIDQFNALGIDEYITDALILWGNMPYNDFLADIEMGSVKVR